MLHNLTHLFHRFALTEYYFRESLPKPPMVVYLRKSEVLIGQVTKGLQSLLRGRPLMVDIFQ